MAGGTSERIKAARDKISSLEGELEGLGRAPSDAPEMLDSANMRRLAEHVTRSDRIHSDMVSAYRDYSEALEDALREVLRVQLELASTARGISSAKGRSKVTKARAKTSTRKTKTRTKTSTRKTKARARTTSRKTTKARAKVSTRKTKARARTTSRKTTKARAKVSTRKTKARARTTSRKTTKARTKVSARKTKARPKISSGARKARLKRAAPRRRR